MKAGMMIRMSCGLGCLVLCAVIGSTESAPVVDTEDEALEYLSRFGYVPTTSPGSAQITDKKSALRRYLLNFQYMAGIKQTGELDADTMRMMNTPRCAVPDNVGSSSFMRRRKRYTTEGSKWGTTSLRYKFQNYTQKLPQATTRSVVEKAFGIWSAVTPLTFTETSGAADINLLYAAGAHGDASPFDGVGGVLAHAYFPASGGAAHFDEAELWTDGRPSGTNLLEVTTHEFGHSLGLGHSNIQTAVMAPYYSGYKPNLKLDQGDILGIQYLYGARTGADRATTTRTVAPTTTRTVAPTTTRTVPTTAARPTTTTTQALTSRPTTTTTRTTTTTTTTRTSLPPSVCSNAAIDAIVVVDGVTYAFQGSRYFILTETTVAAGYPRPISDTWPSVGGNIDAALYYEPTTQLDRFGNQIVTEPGHLFLFKGSKYWKFANVNQLNSDYPKNIAEGFPGIPNNIDTAFFWSGNNRMYFVKGNQYYRYTRGAGADAGYPKPMSGWPGVPSPLSAAFQWTNRRTYFFSGQQYWRFNDVTFNVDSDFPRPTSVWWFGCPAAASLLAGPPDSMIHESESGMSQFEEIQSVGGGNTAGAPSAYGSLGCVIRATMVLIIGLLLSL